jgi:hypothetical protein
MVGVVLGRAAPPVHPGALASITRTLADHLADQAITLNTINPGPVDTGHTPPEIHEALRHPHRWLPGQPVSCPRPHRHAAPPPDHHARPHRPTIPPHHPQHPTQSKMITQC